jgi:hypothetical protein
MDVDGDGARREFELRGQRRGTGGRGGRLKCRGMGRSAGVSRVKEVIEQIDCLTARRGVTVVCQMARIQLFLETVSTITVILEADADGSIHLLCLQKCGGEK